MRWDQSDVSFTRDPSNKQTGVNDEARMMNDEISSNSQMTNMESEVCRSSFGFRYSFVIRHSTFVISAMFAVLSILAEPSPSAKDILDSVRMIESRQQIDLAGQLRQENVVIPFRLVQNGPLIRYSFTNPDEILQLRLGENSSRLDLVTDAGTEKVGLSKLQEQIRGTIVTYGDLAFKFLYWAAARVLGEESVRTRKCWKLQLRAPSRESQYSNVLLWVDKASGALMRMEGYDWNAQLIKRFEVVSAQKIEGRWFLKQMRVEQLQSGTNHARARAYLEIRR